MGSERVSNAEKPKADTAVLSATIAPTQMLKMSHVKPEDRPLSAFSFLTFAALCHRDAMKFAPLVQPFSFQPCHASRTFADII